jgi:cytochrome b6-f complex iron-sulfur subunit
MNSTRLDATDPTVATSANAAGEAESAQPSRRRLLGWVWGGLLAVLAGEVLWVAGAFLRPRRSTAPADQRRFVAGPVERFAPETVTAFPGGKFYLARLADGGFLALDRTCTHLGCTVPWNGAQRCFQCPCHASTFDITGAVLAPPAPRPLDLYPVRIENGIVKVDTSHRVRRRGFDPSQAARA